MITITMSDGTTRLFSDRRMRLSYDGGVAHVYRWEEPGEQPGHEFSTERRYAVVYFCAAKGEWKHAEYTDDEQEPVS